MKSHLVISCHADSGFESHKLQVTPSGDFYGHLDNFVGVFVVMQAFFSGRLDRDNVRIELTYGEETNMAGAYEVLDTLSEDDLVVVVDVTGTVTDSDIVIEKCDTPQMQQFVRDSLKDLSYELFEGCPDPIANEDECDVYKEKLENVFFLGIPCSGGDYNEGMVHTKARNVKAATEAIIQMVDTFSRIKEKKHTQPDAPADAGNPPPRR